MAALRTLRVSRPVVDPVVLAVRREERVLLATLSAWSVISVLGGAVVWWRARGTTSRAGRAASAFGRQTAIWGLVDAVIAVRGLRGHARASSAARSAMAAGSPSGVQSSAQAARRHGRRLAALTGANAVLDVGYAAGGAALAARSARLRGDGVAVALQGVFLLWLDLRHAVRFLDHVRRDGGGRGPERS
jgi:hypothetical protein